jgi:drug/metabolite transporter (DMT)-like permease
MPGSLAAAITVVTWASAFPAIRLGLEGFTPLGLGLARLVCAAVGLGAVALVAAAVLRQDDAAPARRP